MLFSILCDGNAKICHVGEREKQQRFSELKTLSTLGLVFPVSLFNHTQKILKNHGPLATLTIEIKWA
jgi:hypothetical protein